MESRTPKLVVERHRPGLNRCATTESPITAKVAALANQFPTDYSGDPCDRIIRATALAEGMILVTKDAKISECKLLQALW
jgi:PIN domain nuclease of toxin-antitoxin system